MGDSGGLWRKVVALLITAIRLLQQHPGQCEVLDNGYEWSDVRQCGPPSVVLTDLVPPSIDRLAVNSYGRVTLSIAIVSRPPSSSSSLLFAGSRDSAVRDDEDDRRKAVAVWPTGSNASYAVTVTSDNPRVAVTSGYSFSSLEDVVSATATSGDGADCDRNLTASFTVRGQLVGRCSLRVVVTCCEGERHDGAYVTSRRFIGTGRCVTVI